MAGTARYRPNVDYTVATQTSIDGHPAFTPDVNVTGGSGLATNATIVGPLGSQAAATSVSTTASTEDVARIGATNETAPATDTAASGLNGRLQRIAQRITSLIALLPTALGAGGGLKVDGSGTALPVSGTVTANLGTIAGVATAAKQPALGTAGTASADVITVQGIASMTPLLVTPSVPVGGTYTDRSIANLAGTSETLMASNASRKVLVVYNIGATSVAVNLTGGTASLTAGGSVVLQAGGSLVLDTYPPSSAITIIGTTNADVTAYEG